jgi:hypothetical protein
VKAREVCEKPMVRAHCYKNQAYVLFSVGNVVGRRKMV